MQAQRTGKSLAGAVVICKVWRLAIAPDISSYNHYYLSRDGNLGILRNNTALAVKILHLR
jgi:hypothetical protein